MLQTQTQTNCLTPEQQLEFLRRQLTTTEEASAQQHLDTCETCRTQLEQTAASDDVWHEAQQYLSDRSGTVAELVKSFGNSHDGRPKVLTTSATEDLPDAPVQIHIQNVLNSLNPTDDPRSLGRLGGYEVTGVVGSGGMGVVLKAHEGSLDRVVAIKVMAPHLAGSGAARKRFAREAKAAAAIIHPNVMAIHSVSNDGPLPYLVMPFVGGDSLQQRLDQNGPLPLVEVLRLGNQIAAGLAAAHGQGLVHRDIKPANILLDNGVERVSLTDFGLARAVDDASMTRTGVIAGTPQFMSPEQARGESIDHRSDLFSLGSVLYAMCTGHAPFRAETSYGVLRRITDDESRPIREINSDIPEWLEAFVMKLLSKSADDRFESAEQVAELLEECLAHAQQPTTSPLPEPVAVLAKPKKRSSRWTSIFVAVALMLAMFAGVTIIQEMNKGTLTIKCAADDVPIRIRQGDNVVKELTVSRNGKSVTIAAGKYVVEVDGEFTDLSVNDGVVSLKRGETEVVTVVQTLSDELGDGDDHKEVAANTGKISGGTEREAGGATDSDSINWQNVLQGSWNVVQRGGSDSGEEDPAEVRCFIRGNRAHCCDLDGSNSMMFDLVIGAKGPPQHIDLKVILNELDRQEILADYPGGKGDNDEPIPEDLLNPVFNGIIEQRGDQVRICSSGYPCATRPIHFTVGSDRVIWTLTRVPEDVEAENSAHAHASLVKAVKQFNARATLERGGDWIARVRFNPGDSAESNPTIVVGDYYSDIDLTHLNGKFHVVGCYESKDGKPVRVDVQPTDHDVIVVLTARNAVHWKLNAHKDARVKAVLFSGGHKQTLSHNLPESVEVHELLSVASIPGKLNRAQRKLASSKRFYAWSPFSDQFPHMQKRLLEMYRKPVNGTYQAEYHGSSFTIDGKRGKLMRFFGIEWASLVWQGNQLGRVATEEVVKSRGELERLFADGMETVDYSTVTRKLAELRKFLDAQENATEIAAPEAAKAWRQNAVVQTLNDGNDEYRPIGFDSDEPADQVETTEEDHASATPWEELLAEDDRFSEKYHRAIEEATDDVALNRVYEKLDPREIMTPQYLAFEEQNRGTNEGLKSLIKVAQMARSVGDPNSVVGKGRVEVIDRLTTHYLQHKGLEKVAVTLNSGPIVPHGDSFLQTLVEKSPFRKTQAEALIAQIIKGKKVLMIKSQLPSLRERIRERLAAAPQSLQDEYRKQLQQLENTDSRQLKLDLNEKLARLVDSYSHVEVQFYGTAGVASLHLSHAINKVIIGSEAPEITATDIDGAPFRLSSLRGKFTVLVFAQCPGEIQRDMYAPLRQLVAKYEATPVRVVGIMSSDNRKHLADAKANGDFNWTVVPQPLNGPIQLDWGIEVYPTVFIVDADGILHPPLHMPYYGEGGYDTKEVDEKLEELLRAAAKTTGQADSEDDSANVPTSRPQGPPEKTIPSDAILRVGERVHLNLTGAVARKYAEHIGNGKEVDATDGLEISTIGEVTQRLSDGRVRIETWSSPRIVFTEHETTLLIATVDSSAIKREKAPRGTVIASSPGVAIESMTSKEIESWRLTLSNLDDVLLKDVLSPLPPKLKALSELQFKRTAPALVDLLRLNGDGTSHIEKIGFPTNFGGIKDVDEIRSAGNDYIAVAARRFPPEVEQPFGEHGDGMIFLFDTKGNLEAKFGGKVAPDGVNSEDVQFLTLGTDDQWFAVVHQSQPGGVLPKMQKIFLIEPGFPLAFQIHAIKSMAWTSAPHREFDFGFEHFFNPSGIPNREFGKGRDGKRYHAVLGWDAKARKFRGPSQLIYKDKLLFNVRLNVSKRFQALDAPDAESLQLTPAGNAQSTVETFLTAALAGEITTSRKLAPAIPSEQVEEFNTLFETKQINIDTVHVDAASSVKAAIAITKAVRLKAKHKQPDGQRDGFLVLSLEASKSGWHVTDIDFEDEEGLEGELARFVAEHPEAVLLPKTPDGTVKVIEADDRPLEAPVSGDGSE